MPSSRVIRIIIFGSAALWAGVALFAGETLTWSMARPLGLVAAVACGGAVLFDRWLWSWPVVNKLTGRPNLKGTWKAELRSSFKDRKKKPIPCFLRIDQTYSTISVLALFEHSQSISLSSDLRASDGRCLLSYLFTSHKRTLQGRDNPTQRGAASLTVEREPAMHLEGDYWMELGTRGQISTVGRTRKRYVTYNSASAGTYR